MTNTRKKEYTSQIGDEESVAEAVVRTIASVSGRPVLELPPLQQSIDTDSLDMLFASSTTIDSLQFRYAGYQVVVEPESVRIWEHE